MKFGFLLMVFGGDTTYRSGFSSLGINLFFPPRQRDHDGQHYLMFRYVVTLMMQYSSVSNYASVMSRQS